MYELWLKLGPLAVPLLLCSLVASTIIVERLIFFITINKHHKNLKDSVNKLFISKILTKQQAQDQISLLLFEFELLQTRGLKALQLISIISPMLGLLGTVIGIMKSFQDISTSYEPVSPALLANGLWQAILTTVFGIAIAIIATLFFAIFKIITTHNNNKNYLKFNKIVNINYK